MIAIIGFIVVIVAVCAGYALGHGSFGVLLQPAEFVTIAGAAAGSVLVSTPKEVLSQMVKQITGVFRGKSVTKANYLELLKVLFEVFQAGRKGGLMSLESHAEYPDKSEIFKKYPHFLGNHHAVEFLADSLKVMISGGLPPMELEALMDSDLEAHHEEVLKPSAALNKVGDALPGLGIVAAVLGIIITMGAIGGEAAAVGRHVAAALVGTFLGVLLAYGFVGPLATNMEHSAQAESRYIVCMKTALVAYAKGASPLIAVEFARRSITQAVRPTWNEMESSVKGKPVP